MYPKMAGILYFIEKAGLKSIGLAVTMFGGATMF
jgi:hypothetical protein